jgi:glycosyltransferase involved in cell wall biosynthesis
MKIALILMDLREDARKYSETVPRFATGNDSVLEGFATMPDLEVHVVSCIQRNIPSPPKLAENIWFHSLYVPKIGWLRTGYQGCIRATRRKLREIRPDIVQGVGTERECAISAIFSGFPNVVEIAGNMAELARLNRPRFGSYLWFAARFENFTLPRTAGVICNSAYTQDLVRNRTRRTWLIYPGLRSVFLDPPPKADDRPCAIVVAGVISPRKRQLELLEVAETLHRQGLKLEFRFVGYHNELTPYSKAFFERIKPMAAAGYARYVGSPDHNGMVKLFDSVAGMIHFPTEEAFGSVAAEALARDLKFFGARTGGIVDIASGAPGAELIDGNNWTGLTNAIAGWARQGCPRPTDCAALMRKRYHPVIFAQQHLDAYHEVLGRGCG